MSEQPEDIGLRLRVLNAQGKPLGGKVDITAAHPDLANPSYIHGADASQEIDVRGLSRSVQGPYQVTVTQSGTILAQTQGVTIPAQGAATAEFTLIGIEGTPATASGTLVADDGTAAAGITTRLYSIGYGGVATLLGQAASTSTGSWSISYRKPATGATNLQVRVLDSTGAEVTLSTTQYNAGAKQTLGLVVPSSVQPPAPEYEQLATTMNKSIDGVARLSIAQENVAQQDLTLLNQNTNWDARITALGALAAQHVAATGISQEALYSIYRAGLPTDPQALATVPASTVESALTAAGAAGVTGLNADQVKTTVAAFSTFAGKSQLATITPGGISTFSAMAAASIKDPNQQAAFTNLYFNNLAPEEFWSSAAQLGIGADQLSALKLQGKFLYLTFNNVPLATVLQQQVGSIENLPQLAQKDFDQAATWQSTLETVVNNTPNSTLDALIPAVYTGATTADRLAAYTGDMARKVRISYPTEVAARMLDREQLAVTAATSAPAAAFLRSAAALGYSLGRTPLNAFLASSDAQLPALDADTLATVKTLHRMYQVTTSNEAYQAALTAGFTSARQIAAIDKDDFIANYGAQFPSLQEAEWTWARSTTVSSVTFNICSSAMLMDTAPPVYSLSASPAQKQAAKNSLIQQFPSIATLFGNMDYCECQDCSSVLSPAAYFVDVLQMIGPPNSSNGAPGSGANSKGFTPLDVLIGTAPGVNPALPGRRPDLGALPLSCENTNTSMPYIDLVNEIFEYFIANSKLDTSLAYDTGTATTAELTAEPQNILPSVYNTNLKQAFYPLNLPFDLWIATVRGFLGYFKTTLASVLETLRPVDQLELFTDANNFPYYRAQILAESLGIAPCEYQLLTGTATGIDPIVSNWFKLYGYPTEAAALSGNADLDPLSNAETLSDVLGLTYQQVTDLLETKFINPGLYPLIYQFQRLGISMSDAFSYTGQPGYPALSAADTATFEAQLNAITVRYKSLDPDTSFDAIAWLESVAPANYSKQVLVLADPDTGCNFSTTTLQYADNATPASAYDFVRINLFVRLWQKLGWTMGELDRALTAFFPTGLPAWTDPGFSAAYTNDWKTALVYLAHLDDLNTRLQPAMGRDALLPFWSSLPVQGPNPLYGQLFVVSSVLNNDWAFDDPAGNFPVPLADLTLQSLQAFSSHLASIQGVLGLAATDIDAIFADPGVNADTVVVNGATVPAFTLNNLSTCYRYSMLAKCLNLSVTDTIDLKQMMPASNPFTPVSGAPISTLAEDVLFNTTLQFVKNAQAVEASGFTVEDLQYLLRHQFDPVGKYQVDQNAQLTLLQQTAAGLAQIATQNALPANLVTMPESLLDQTLSGLIPATILKNLFTLLTNAQAFTATASAPADIDPTPFAAETELSFSYDPVAEIQTVTCTGLLLDWKKTELLAINGTPEFNSLLDGLQQAAITALQQNIANILGVWASLVEYEAVETGVSPGFAEAQVAELTATDPALNLSYDAVGHLQWAGYRGVLIDAGKNALAAVAMPSAALANLLSEILSDLQSQSLATYESLAGSLVAMLVNAQIFEATSTPVTAADQVDPAAFAAAVATAQQNGVITAPVPPIQFSYDAATQAQTIAIQGVLTDALRAAISGLPGVSATAQTLLQSARTGMASLYSSLAGSLVTVGANDLDTNVAPFLGLNATQSQRQAKADLIEVFLPLQAQSLSLSFILQTLSSGLSADPSLTAALVTDTALLSDPSNPGKALQSSFLGLGQPGISASWLKSDGTLLASNITVTADTAVAPAAAAGFSQVVFTGYLQVPTDGAYRFFAELGDIGATAQFELTAPPNSPLLANPILPGTVAATVAHDEISQFVTLSGGVFYQFTLTFATLGANGASLLVQGENMAKGPLSQVVLCPQTAANSFLTAYTLLAKALQILQTTAIDEREISYMIANAPLFANLRLSSLPTAPSDANMTSLFEQALMLIDYADLRKNPAGATDGLIDVFEGVNTPFTEAAGSAASNSDTAAPWTALANLFRRDVASVRAIATYFGLITDTVAGATETVTADGEFGDNKGIRRTWQALQLIRVLGIPVAAATASTAIASLTPPPASLPNQVATNFKNAVRARYTLQQWLPIAQSVFDPIRQQKRDALVAYLLQELGFDSENQLFEYFLVDPGMEPVVQTSRLRLGMNALQTFVQRCLLNLENGNSNPALNISPSAIDADWWSWMKRYRVWEANREIFLYPENWMEPEMRLGMSDLFESLESDLLQGDVTDDLATQAFLNYLTGLELRARLDVVATYFDQNLTNAGLSTLHVLARTYAHPHKYFYRTYTSLAWTPWIAVTPDIDGDHIALAIWKGRLNVFWLTWITQTQAPSSSSSDDTALSSLQFSALTGDISNAGKSTKLVQVQLHWCDYYQGKWSTRISSDINKYPPIAVPDTFDASQVRIRINKEGGGATAGEGAVNVILDFPSVLDPAYEEAWDRYRNTLHGRKGIPTRTPPRPSYTFRVTSKNCDLVLLDDFYNTSPLNPYNATTVDATLFTGSGSLSATFDGTFVSTSGGSTTSTSTTEPILRAVHSFALLPCSNPVVPSPFLDPSQPDYTQAGALVSPFFFKDTHDPSTTDEMTFYVQPSLTETTIDNWSYWAVRYSPVDTYVSSGAYLSDIPILAQAANAGPGVPVEVDTDQSLYAIQDTTDWLTSPATAVLYGGTIVGQFGGINAETQPAPATPGTVAAQPTALSVAQATAQAAASGRIVLAPRGIAASQVSALKKTVPAASANNGKK
jgi:hypothetical protein